MPKRGCTPSPVIDIKSLEPNLKKREPRDVWDGSPPRKYYKYPRFANFTMCKNIKKKGENRDTHCS